MASVLKRMQKPVVSIRKDATVMDAVHAMLEARVGATVILEDGKAKGIFTERDLMAKVVLAKRNAETTPVSAVMTSPVIPISQNADPEEALRIMVDRHIRHLPVVDATDKVVGMLSMRHLMRARIDELTQEVGALANYIGSDGIGG
jgi:CBS domain-containing protein